jgi:type I restriction enzyme, S subunit
MGAVEKLITDNLPIWSSSIESKLSAGRGKSSKRTLYGVKKLRELILDLAVRGLLVPQDPNDEPASVLLEKIVAEKEQLVKEGKITKQKKKIVTVDGEITPTVPTKWSTCRFGDIYHMEYGDGLSKSDRSNTGEFPVYGSNGVVGTHNEACVLSPCIVIGRKGSAGALNICTSSGCWVTDVAYSLVPSKYLLLEFVLTQLKALHLDNLGKGIKPGLNRNEAYSHIISIPPLAEQHRIVAKVDELMALCDTLEQQQEDSIQAHETLVETLLNTLTKAADANAFQSAWQRVSAHFDTLLTTEHSVDKLKETILQLAVMGKLVPQDPNDEPASVLLEKIAAEKESLRQISSNKNKRLAENLEANPIETKKHWAAARVNELFVTAQGVQLAKDVQKAECLKGYKRYLYISDFKSSKSLKYVEDKYPNKEVTKDDLVMANTGSPGEVYYGIEGILSNNLFKISFNKEIFNKEYVYNFFKSPLFTNELNKNLKGAAQQHLGHKLIGSQFIYFPAITEQRRIVTKVDELMALCEGLKQSLREAQTTQIHLTDAVVENAI